MEEICICRKVLSVNGATPDENGNVTVDTSGLADDSSVVHKTGNETIAGTKTFNSTIIGSVTGNAGTATKATQDSDGNQINTTYAKNGHLHNDWYYSKDQVNNLLNGKANTSGTYSGLTVGNANNGVDSYGGLWIRFKNGIQMCWGSGIFQEDVSYSKAFNSEPRLICTPAEVAGQLQELVVNFYSKSSTKFACRLWNVNRGDWQSNGNFDWLAIGTWK